MQFKTTPPEDSLRTSAFVARVYPVAAALQGLYVKNRKIFFPRAVSAKRVAPVTIVARTPA
jgi:hypothetical protein